MLVSSTKQCRNSDVYNIPKLVYQILIYKLEENSRFLSTTLVEFVCLRFQVKDVRFGQQDKCQPRTNLKVTHWPHHTTQRWVHKVEHWWNDWYHFDMCTSCPSCQMIHLGRNSQKLRLSGWAMAQPCFTECNILYHHKMSKIKHWWFMHKSA
jgi:hypothetical protein